MLKSVIAAVVAGLSAGCATYPPNTPGKGSGMTYTPVIDLQGMDGNRYSNDLDSCRQYSASINANEAAISGALGGALISASIMAAVGGTSRHVGQFASGGAVGGSARASGRAVLKQETIIANCMATRGYRVIDGTATVAYSPAAYVPTPAPAALAAPSQAAPVAQQPLAAMSPPPQLPPPHLAQTPREVMPKLPVPAKGEDGINAARYAQSQQCSKFDVGATFVAKGPGFETYSVQCSNGETLIVRCDFGNCRSLK